MSYRFYDLYSHRDTINDIDIRIKKMYYIEVFRLFIILVLTFILLLTLFLGSRMIFSGDFFYLADQARDMLLTQDIWDNKNITLIGTHSGLGGFFHGPLWLYQLIPFYLIGGGDPFTFTYAYVMIALTTVLVGYFVGASLYGKKAGLLSAFLLAVTPSLWLYVPNTIGVNMLPLVFLAIFYFLVKYIRGDGKSFIFAVFFAGLSLQYETALPLIVIPLVIASVFLNKKAVKNVKLLALSLGALVLSLATFILFDLKHQFLMTNSLLGMFTSGKKEEGYLYFPERIVSHLQSMQSVYESILIRKTLLLELVLIAILACFLYYIVKKKFHKKKEWKEILYLLLFPVAVFVVYLAYAYPVFPEYLLGLTIPVALAFVFIAQHIWKMQFGKVLVVLFVFGTVFEAGSLLSAQYLKPYQPNTTAGSYKNQKNVTDWIFTDSKGKAFGYFVYTPSTYTYGMDYLMWWEAKTKGVAKPENKKLPTTYLVLYPPLDNDQGAHAFWKKTKVRTNAKVISKKTFTGGIIVEKLSVDPKEPEVDPTLNQNLIFR